MDLTLTSEQELIRSTAREFLEARCPPSHVREMLDSPDGYSPALYKEMVELSWTDSDLGFLDLCLLVEEMGRVLLPSPFVTTVVHCGTALAGNDDLLGAIARGERLMSFGALSWDGSGAGPTLSDDVLDGELAFVPYAHVAHDLVVVADDGTTVVVDAHDAVVERLDVIGVAPACRVRFDGARASRVLGDVAGSVIEHATAAACAEMVGGAQRVLEMTVEYASGRTQFGVPVGSFQAVQHHCANMASDVLGARFMAYEAIWRLSEGLDATQEVAMAKAWCSDAYQRVCALGHQVHGAIGFTQEYDLHLYLRHATGAELAFGDADHHWERIAQNLGL